MSITHAGETFQGLRIPKSSPKGTKSHAVLIGTKDKPKVIRFGEKGAETNKNAAQRKSFKARHAKNIAKGETSAAYWANKVKWKA
jgi:hypothetical protein|tara:strand:+ start:115 stop:369 length:255 start_codon:yes stop_codon:yes gene_type:complete